MTRKLNYDELEERVKILNQKASQRKAIEDALRTEKNKLDRISKSIGAGIVMISKDYKTIWANEIIKEVFGDVENKPCYSTFNKRQQICPGCGVKQVFETGAKNVVHEQKGEDAEGQTIWSQIIATPLYDVEGNIESVLEVVMPITERKLSEKALRESEERYRSLAENSRVGIWHISVDGYTKYLNPSMCTMLEIESLKDLEGQTYHSFFTPKSLTTMEREHAKRPENIASSYEVEIVGRKGNKRNVIISGAPLFDENDKLQGLIGTFTDVTDLRKAEEELQRSSFYLDSVNDTLIILNVEREIIKVNKEFENLWGYPSKEVLGKPFSILFPEEDLKKHFSIMQEAIVSKKPHLFDTIALTKSGGKVPVSIRGSAIFNKDEKFEGFIGIFRDITDRKKTEDALKKYREHLEELVDERTEEIRKINESLSESERKLAIHAKELEEGNIALKVLLKQRENDKTELEENILSNVKHLVLPYIIKLKRNRTMSEDLAYLNILESNLNEIISPFSVKLSSKYLGLTPKEIQIADLIKEGKQDKDIMEILNISQTTVKSHRQNIRKKLGIYSKRANLKTYLLSLKK